MRNPPRMQKNLYERRIFQPNPLLKRPKNIEPVIRIRGNVSFNNGPYINDCIIGLQQDFMVITWQDPSDAKRTNDIGTENCKKINYNNFLFYCMGHENM